MTIQPNIQIKVEKPETGNPADDLVLEITKITRHRELWIDFTLNGVEYHAEFDYPKFIVWLHDHPEIDAEFLTFKGFPYYTRRDGGQTKIMHHVKDLDGSEDMVPETVSFYEVAERYEEHIPAFLRDAMQDEELKGFIIPVAAYYQEDMTYSEAKDAQRELFLNR